MLIKENNSKNQEKNMKQTTKKYLRCAAALALFGGMVFTTPATLQAKTTAADISVHVEVNVHGSDIGVSSDVLEETVDRLLEEAEIEVSESGGSNVTELKIDIYKDPKRGFKAAANWDDDDDPEIEKYCAEQDEIDNIVEEEVNAFIAFLRK